MESEVGVTRSFHMCIDIRGVLRWSNRELKGMFRSKTGEPVTGKEVRKFLEHELSLGHEKYPMGNCPRFDWKKGCLGHAEPDFEVTTV